MLWSARPSWRLALSQAAQAWQVARMKKRLAFAALVLLQHLAAAPAVHAQASAAQAAGKTKPSPLAPSEIVAAAPKGEWVVIAASDLLVMDLAPDAKGKARRVVIQLMAPAFSQGWVSNIRTLAKAHWWDGLSINRVQDNYVVQWGDGNADDKTKAKALPEGLKVMPESEYRTKLPVSSVRPGYCAQYSAEQPCSEFERSPAVTISKTKDAYATETAFYSGWPIALVPVWNGVKPSKAKPVKGLKAVRKYSVQNEAWPVHCYGMVGVGRDLSPNTGSGAELYTVIGHAPRHLDRNIALVGRVIEGIEHLSSLPRGHGGLGFYDLELGDERVSIVSIHPGVEVKDLPVYEYLSTESASFAKYADARANRRDAFFIRPAGGADVCNIPVPVRRAK